VLSPWVSVSRQVPVQQRARVLIKFQTLLVENKEDIAASIVAENGKTMVDALGDVTRGIEVVEHCIAMPSLMMGEAVEQISSNMDTKTVRQPLGVVAGIAPFNFPAMIPLWMLPIAVSTGNAFILKPSEKVPTASHKIVKLATQAGVPPGIISILHGGVGAVNFLCSHKDIKAVSFVGSGHVGRIVYDLATKHGKRAQAQMLKSTLYIGSKALSILALH
jgi:malonate-semialdehyde dehydrogenase (acetylating) / methylmalonate-semialdehyde dehydrogenase